jgi:hypothetical protein
MIVPGIYNNITLADSTADLTLQPGLYCLTGNFSAPDGTIVGNGVTLVLLGGKIDLTGSASITLSAMPAPSNLISTDGSTWNYGGLLLFADPNQYSGSADPDSIQLGGSNSSQYSGTLYAPNTKCALNSGSGTLTFNSQVYCYRINLSGSANLLVNFNPDQNWLIPPQLELAH